MKAAWAWFAVLVVAGVVVWNTGGTGNSLFVVSAVVFIAAAAKLVMMWETRA